MVASFNDIKEQQKRLKTQRAGIIARFSDERIASRLMAMGVLPGSRIELVRPAPFGGGWYAKVDKLLLALREQEIGSIILRP